MDKNKIFTIGLLVGGITDTFTVSVCRGAIKAAKEANVKLVIFPAKYLDRDYLKPSELMYEYQYNTLLSYAQKENMDAVLIAAESIGFCTTKEKIKKMLEKYTDIPCVLIASKIEGYVSVNYDNKSGIKEALEYLIHHLNCRKIGMIGGPDENTDAYERKQAFLETLKEHGIPFEERSYVEGRLSRFSEDAFATFIRQNPDVEAVFCVNDDTAVGLYEALKKHNMQPGKQVMIFGYDNILLATKLKPALSSISADKAKLGEVALELALKMLKGENVESLVLPTKFIRRDSIRNDILDNQDNILDKEYINARFQNLFNCYEEEDSQYVEIKNVFDRLILKIINIYEDKESLEEDKEEILTLLEDFLTSKALDYADMEQLVLFIQQIYRKVKRKYQDGHMAHFIDVLVLVYSRIILAINQRYSEISELQNKKNVAMKVLTRDIMQFEKGNDQSYMALLKNLNWLDIQNSGVYVFEQPMLNLYQDEFVLPEKMYLKAVLKEGEIQSVLAQNQEVAMSDIFTVVCGKKASFPQIILPLYSNEMVYGVLLCDMADIFYENGDYFVNHMGSAIKMIDLLKTNDKIQHQLEQSVVTLKENNIALNSMSKIDVLTGIFNRRGFYDAAEAFIQNAKEQNKDTIVAYIDMNNLKIVNDRYGHDEGDFSIKKIAELLQEAVKEKGVVGRIGGDEFAIVMSYENETNMIRSIYDRFQNYNKTSPKEYNITVSAGMHIVKYDSELTLKEALTHADEMLYEEKKNRIKQVTK